ncbi:hypothetical protein [uncultured Bilophila sp.]|nr:hypothetical protein [uncultured Bilophila sp.]
MVTMPSPSGSWTRAVPVAVSTPVTVPKRRDAPRLLSSDAIRRSCCA